MLRLFIYTNEFNRLWKLAGLNDIDMRKLENELLNNTKSGRVIQGTRGLRKLRWKIRGKGKSGGIRIFYIDFPMHSKLFLISVLFKNEDDNIGEKEKQKINNMIKSIEINLNNEKR